MNSPRLERRQLKAASCWAAFFLLTFELIESNRGAGAAIKRSLMRGDPIMTTYTIINTSGEIEARGCSIETAAVELLGHDNHIWSIEPSEAGEGFDLWISRLGGGGNWPGGRVKSTIFFD